MTFTKKTSLTKKKKTNKRIQWLYGIQDWLSSLGVNSVLPTHQTFLKNQLHGRSINLTIDRLNCRKFLNLIEKTEKIKKTPLLFDKKRIHYLFVKESVNIKQLSHRKSLTEDQAAKLIDLKESGLKLGQNPKGLLRDRLSERLGFPKLETKNFAHDFIQETIQKVSLVGAVTFKAVLNNPKQINVALAEHIAGVFDGDGSIRVGLLTHLSKSGKKLDKRHTFEIVPSINLTAQIEENDFLFKIINAAFGKKKALTIVNVNLKGKGKRLIIKNTKSLREYVVPFFTTYPPLLKKNQIRFEIFCTTLEKLPLNYKNEEKMITMIREIYAKDLYKRDKSLEDFLKIVKLDYN